MNMIKERMASGTLDKRMNSFYTLAKERKVAFACPVNISEIYSLGISVQYFTGNVFLDMAAEKKGDEKSAYQNMALDELENKNKIEKIADNYLEKILYDFYQSGGLKMEDSLSSEEQKKTQALYSKLMEKYLAEQEALCELAENKTVNKEELNENFTKNTLSLYNHMAKIYSETKMQKPWLKMINLLAKS